MEKRVLMALAFGLFALMAIAIVAAQDRANLPPLPGNETANITYGNCVSFYAAQKNACYHSVKSVYRECSDAAKNVTDKAELKKCLQEYKSDKKECKTRFKDAKKLICGPIKHNFFDEVVNSFK